MYVQGNSLHLVPTSLIKIMHKIHILCRTIERSHAIIWKFRDSTIFVSCDFDEDEKKNFRYRESFRSLYISFLASLLDIQDIYKTEIISESRKSVKHRSEYHLGWSHAEYRVYRGPLCSCKNRCSAYGFLFPVHPAGRDVECSVFKYKIFEISVRDHFFLFFSRIDLPRVFDRDIRSNLCYSRFTDLKYTNAYSVCVFSLQSLM